MADFIPTKQHLREVILHYFLQGKTGAETHRILSENYALHCPSETTVRDWFRRFKNGDYGVADKERSGAPQKFEDSELEEILDQDPCQTTDELAVQLGVNRSTVTRRLQALGMIQKEGHWVPHKLRDRDIERRLVMSEMLLTRHQRKSFLHRIITGDEKWIFFDNPKRSKAYVKPGTSAPSVAKKNIHGAKVMLCIWWDSKGVIYYELLKPSQTVTAELYKEQLTRLHEALEEKRPEWSHRHEKVILQHDNARPHVARIVKGHIEELKWEVLPHPPYSPDIAPSDYHLFRSLQHGLSGQTFKSYAEVKEWLDSWLASKEPEFFFRGIHLLPERWSKVVAVEGDYFN